LRQEKEIASAEPGNDQPEIFLAVTKLYFFRGLASVTAAGGVVAK